MRKIVYYVAASIDGFISGVNDDINGFVYESEGVNKYLSDLKNFDTVIMGRSTYEFGYKFGIKPGQPSPTYLHMMHYVFSNSLVFDDPHPQVHARKMNIQFIKELKSQSGSDIYLCGGGQFAGWLLDHEMIDILKIKLNPLILGKGTRLFGNSVKQHKTELLESMSFDKGLQIISYKILYKN